MKTQGRAGEALQKVKESLRRIKDTLLIIWKDMGTPGKTWKNIGLPRSREEESEEE